MMIVQSTRSSLRLSVREENGDDARTPPTKKQRLVQLPEPAPPLPPSLSGDYHHSSNDTSTYTSRRRRSYPDFLDVTIDENGGKQSRSWSLQYAAHHKSNSDPSVVLQPRASTLSPRAVSPSARSVHGSYTPEWGSSNNTSNYNKHHRFHKSATTPVAPVATATTTRLLQNGEARDTISPATATVTATKKKRTPGRNNHGSRSNLSPAKVSNRPGSRMPLRRAHNKESPMGLTESVEASDTVDMKETLGKGGDSTTDAGAADSSTVTATATSQSVTSGGPAVTERRSLRSQDAGARSRCELASYFPNYEELLSLDPPEPEYLTGETTVKLIDDVTIPPIPSPPATESPFGNPLLHIRAGEAVTLPDAEPNNDTEDPLNVGTYFRAHRRIERQEIQLRNIERERAQHEKLRLDRILDELRGNDWLRVMGIGGITDGEKKLYEPKRNLFIKEISALVEKFRSWKEEEKRRRFDKEKMSRVETATPDGPGDVEMQQRGGEPGRAKNTTHPDDAILSDVASHGESADSNDVDTWAAQQLHQEVKSASTPKRPKISYDQRRRQKSPKDSENLSEAHPEAFLAQSPLPSQSQFAPPIEKPFTSFFSRRSLRDHVLSKNRRGRTSLAFGQPLPDMEQHEFELPSDILTDDAIRACRRKRRRVRRERITEGQAG